jgi:hypothetical protein
MLLATARDKFFIASRRAWPGSIVGDILSRARGGTEYLFKMPSIESAPGPKINTISDARRKRNAASEKKASGSLKMLKRTSRLAVRYATLKLMISGTAITRDARPTASRRPQTISAIRRDIR